MPKEVFDSVRFRSTASEFAGLQVFNLPDEHDEHNLHFLLNPSGCCLLSSPLATNFLISFSLPEEQTVRSTRAR